MIAARAGRGRAGSPRASASHRRGPTRSCRLVAALGLAVAVAAGCGGEGSSEAAAIVELRSVDEFETIEDEVERSKALFIEAGRVIQHPRCLNCHPTDPHPRQGARLAMHEPPVVAGDDNHGVPAMQCQTCHQEGNIDFASLPGNPVWHLAPRAMGWIGLSLGEICEQLKDPARNGGRDLAAIHEHMADDLLVGWAWNPGPGRDPAPGTQSSFGRLLEAWIDTGAHCPDGEPGAQVVQPIAGSDCAGCHEGSGTAD